MLSEKIRSYRKQAGMSQEQLAEKLNVSRQAVTKWETGVGIPDIVNLKGLAKLFSVFYPLKYVYIDKIIVHEDLLFLLTNQPHSMIGMAVHL